MVGLNFIDSVPNCLQILIEEKFFTPCSIHGSLKKNEKNIYCLDCCLSICPHCLRLHRPHLLLQVRRYMYNDVIRLGDAQKLMNCSLVQPYTTNRAKVVFLKQRPTSRHIRSSGNFCITCDRSLQDPYLFCSLHCKIRHLLLPTKCTTIKDSWNDYESSGSVDKARSSESSQETEDRQSSPGWVLCTLSGSTSTESEAGAENLKTPANCTATTDFIPKKRSSVHLVPRVWYRSKCAPAMELAIAVNRRKGVPHRSPLH